MQSKYFQTILLVILLLKQTQTNAWVVEDQKLQIICQTQFYKASKDFKILRYNQTQAHLEIEKINAQINQIQANYYIQEEKKSKMLNNMYHKYNKLSKHLNHVPDQIDFLALSTGIEYGIGYGSSLKLQISYSNAFNCEKQITHLFKTAFSSKTDFYHIHNCSFAVSPKITFLQDISVEYELRFIMLNSLEKIKYSRFFEVQLAGNLKKFSTQYCVDITHGYKFSNNIMLFWQTFCSIEPKNPIKIYQNMIRNQICVAKSFATKSITLQVGYFRYNSGNIINKSIASGILAGVWMEC